MKETPILFNGPMVRAIMDGRKTMTRRVVHMDIVDSIVGNGDNVLHRCPYGDRLWVRETCYVCIDNNDSVHYAADGPAPTTGCRTYRKRPSIFMPRADSRITVDITNIRVEHLQDITDADARAEGLMALSKDGALTKYGIPDRDGLPGNDNDGWHWKDWETSPVAAFRKLWDGINSKRGFSWDFNPWVWVVEFPKDGAA